MRRRALVMTVGVGREQARESYVNGMCRAVRESNPDRLCLICTARSRPLAEEVVRRLKEGGAASIHEVAHGENLERARVEVERALSRLWAEGFAPQDIKVDFTFGTKAMSAGAALAGVSARVDSLQYVGGRRGPNGIVVPGEERVTSFAPSTLYAMADLDLALEMARNLMFRPALEIAKRLTREGHLPEERLETARMLKSIARAYDAWDRFDYAGCLDALKGVRFDSPALAEFEIPSATRERLGQLRSVSRPRHGKPVRYTPDRLADLVCNAERRALEGRYDDGVARLYRATEMLAQWRLQLRYGLETGNLEVERLPPALREKYGGKEAKADRDKVSLGLWRAFELLRDLGHDLGEAFRQAGPLRNMLEARNQSLLAHGVDPVSREQYETFRESLLGLAVGFMGEELESALRDLTFPWMAEARGAG